MNWEILLSPKIGLIDWWSVGHLAWGLFLGAIFILLKNKLIFLNKPKYYFVSGLVLLVIWEIIEIIIRGFKTYFTHDLMKPFVEYENWINVGSDIIIGLIGLWAIYLIFQDHAKQL